jgi:hypothetical protein
LDTKIINVYHERSQRLLSSGLVIVDAALEPLKVLKVLMEGLGPDCKAGLWLTNFMGVPVARTLSPFDLIYLDANYSVVHCVEITTEGEYEPFRGQPASALVLPPKTIAQTRTHAGDRLMFRAVDAPGAQPSDASKQTAAQPASPEARPSSDQPARAHFFNSAFPVAPPQDGGSPLDRFLGSRSSNARVPAAVASAAAVATEENPSPRAAIPTPSGRLTKSPKSLLGNSPSLRPSAGSESIAQALDGSQVSFVIASESAGYTASAAERAQSASLPARAVPAPVARGYNTAPEYAQKSRPQGAAVSGRLLKTVHLAPEMLAIEALPIVEPEVAEPEVAIPDPQAAAAPDSWADEFPNPKSIAVESPAESATSVASHPEASMGAVIPIAASSAFFAPPAPQTIAAPPPVAPIMPAASAVPLPAEPPASPRISLPAVASPISPAPATVAPAAQAPALVRAAPVHRNETMQPPVKPQIEQAAPGAILPAVNEPSEFPRTSIQKPQPKTDALGVRKAKPSWDVRLLYFLFPKYDPALPPEVRIPRMDQKKEVFPDEEETQSRTLQFLCWLYPDLHLDQVQQKRSEQRRAVRLPMPGLVAYFFTGGSPRPHPIKDISVTGFYMQTDERWMPGTIVRVTLQMVESSGEGRRETITVHSRVVRWGPDGGGFEFVLPGFLE